MIKSIPPRLSVSKKPSWSCTHLIEQVMRAVSRASLTSAASFGSSSKWRIWSGDFIFNLLFSRGSDFTALKRVFFFPDIRRRFIDRRPKDAELFDRLYEPGKIHRFDHIGVHAVVIKLNQIRRFAGRSEYHDRNRFQMLIG